MLGEHMNELSQTLEQTITRLKVANNELQRDIKKKRFDMDTLSLMLSSGVFMYTKLPSISLLLLWECLWHILLLAT